MSNTPERIYGWLNSQMSIARHYGSINYNGKRYIVAPNEEGQPLVREDVLKRELKAKKQKPVRAAAALAGDTGGEAAK